MGEIISDAYQYGKEKCMDFVNVDDIFQNLQNQAERLISKEKDIRQVIASQLDMRVTHECQNWLDCVQKVNSKFEEIKMKYERLQENGWNFAILNKMNLSEEMKNLIGEILDILKNEMKLETVLIVDNRVIMVEKKFAEKLEDINTFQNVVEEVLGYLNEESIKSIGIWGMANIGKSAIMANLNDKLGDRRVFEIVIWVTVSKEGSVRKIQNAIADRLKLKVDGNTNDYNLARIIGKALENKKYLILLDDVFAKIDLREVGILHNHKLGKVVLATRYRLVCDLMETDEDIEVKKMKREEAWKMFRKIVGEVVERRNIRPIAERVVNECGELPQLIKIVGRKLKNTIDEETWLRTLSMLQSPSNSRLQPMEEVFNAFKLVYDELDDNLKHCLLYGASFPDDHMICKDRLIECWKAEDLIKNVQTFSKARQEGKILMETLIEKYLLDECKEMEYVKMSVIFRKMALRIASLDTHWLMVVKHDDSPKYPPIEQWGFARVISLTSNKLQCLPKKPECPKLSTFFLHQNQTLTMIPTSFFESMSCLKILNLCGAGITSLPNSISYLVTLTNLYLNQCDKLTILPEQVARLNRLEVLEICETGLYGLPSYIGELTKLQCLKLSFMISQHGVPFDIYMIPYDMLKRLSLLQELTIDIDENFHARWNQLAPIIA